MKKFCISVALLLATLCVSSSAFLTPLAPRRSNTFVAPLRLSFDEPPDDEASLEELMAAAAETDARARALEERLANLQDSPILTEPEEEMIPPAMEEIPISSPPGAETEPEVVALETEQEPPSAPVATTIEPVRPPNTGLVPCKTIWQKAAPTIVQGGNTLKTFSFPSIDVETVHVSLKTNGRPLNSQIDLWHGPDYIPTSTRIYIENGDVRPFNGIFATPKGSNTLAVYNRGSFDFPFEAIAQPDDVMDSTGLAADAQRLLESGKGKLVQGNSITNFPFHPSVKSVQILLNTDGRNLKAQLELMQGPNNDKQIIEFYSSDGLKRPFHAVIQCPSSSGNQVRLLNTNTVEFPFTAYIEPYEVEAP